MLSGNAKVAEERNRQFEEMLRLTQQEKREVEAVNKELRLNKEKLEATLADALLGAASQTPKKSTKKPAAAAEEPDDFPSDAGPSIKDEIPGKDTKKADTAADAAASLADQKKPKTDPSEQKNQPQTAVSSLDPEEELTPVELTKEEISELRNAVHETMAELLDRKSVV